MGGILPDHLILDQILPRLPAKSVTRFKTVCKTWYSAISTPEFIQSHLAYSSSHPQLLVLGHPHPTYFYSLTYGECGQSLGNLVKFDFDITSNLIEVVGSGNGLVCLTCLTPEGGFVLWNPTTSELCIIDRPSHTSIGGAWFGYVSSIDDYKIVAYLMGVCAGDGYPFYFYVYSFKVAEWKRIAVFDWAEDDYIIIRCSKPTLINDTLYWGDHLFDLWDDSKTKAKWIALNLATEQWKEFPQINKLSDKSGQIFALRGFLSLICCVGNRSEVWDVWMLKQQDDWNSWEKSFTVNFRVYCWGFRNISGTGKCVVNVGYSRMKVYDLFEEAEEQSQGVAEFPGNLKTVMPYFETLVSPSSIANGTKQALI